MKILHPVLHYPPVIGGFEQWVQNIAERQPQGIEVFVVTGRVKGFPRREQVKNCFVFRDSLIDIKLNSLRSSFVGIITATPFIFLNSLYIAKKHKVDIIHCHGFIGSIIGYFLSKLTRTPFISTEQGLIDANRGIVYAASNFLRGIVYRKASLCIASSKSVADDFYKIGVRRVEIIPNGVDFSTFANKDDGGAKKEGVAILSVGRLEKVKGHSYLIEAFRNIKGEIPGARLVIVGEGSERKNLETQVKDLGLSDSVELIGAVEHNKLPKFFAQADIFVMPSLSEGFGVVALEAMAAGVPVVASRVGSLSDIIEDEKTGFLVEPQNPEDIKEAVFRILKDSKLRKNIVDNAKTNMHKYNWDTVAQQVHYIYGSLAGVK